MVRVQTCTTSTSGSAISSSADGKARARAELPGEGFAPLGRGADDAHQPPAGQPHRPGVDAAGETCPDHSGSDAPGHPPAPCRPAPPPMASRKVRPSSGARVAASAPSRGSSSSLRKATRWRWRRPACPPGVCAGPGGTEGVGQSLASVPPADREGGRPAGIAPQGVGDADGGHAAQNLTGAWRPPRAAQPWQTMDLAELPDRRRPYSAQAPGGNHRGGGRDFHNFNTATAPTRDSRWWPSPPPRSPTSTTGATRPSWPAPLSRGNPHPRGGRTCPSHRELAVDECAFSYSDVS